MPTNKQLEQEVNETRSQMNRLEEQVDTMSDSLAKILDAVSPQVPTGVPEKAPAIPAIPVGTAAKHQGTSAVKTTDAMEMDLGEEVTIDEETLILRPKNESPDDPFFKKKMDELAFANEPVTIYIQEVHDANADLSFEVSVNGDRRIFIRGETFTVPRYIVEQLARAKPVHYDNIEYTQDNGERSVKWPGRLGLRYPFSIVRDDNPLGPDWFKRVMKERN